MKETSPISVRGEGDITSNPVERGEDSLLKHSFKHACLSAKIADEYRGQDTLVLDLTSVTPIFDYFVLTTANSSRQMRAIADEVNRVLQDEGSQRLGVEGYDASTWLLQDYGDVVLHVFTPETRRVYDLEHLWGDAPRVDWRAACEGAAWESGSRRAAL